MKRWIVPFLVLFIALFLRSYNLGSNPPGLTPDEASLGYNAYSILKTGRDEYGTLLPIVFKSFGDYKPGLYVYLAVPAVATLGLNETTVRLPSVVAGVFTVYLVYLVTKELFGQKQRDSSTTVGMTWLPLIAMVVAATNPWLIYFSRGAWEVNVALTLTLAGIYFFLRSFGRPKLLVASVLFFALTLVCYQGAKLSIGIVVVILAIVYWKELLQFKAKEKFKYVVVSLVVGLIISLPIILSLFNGQSGRLTVFSVFSYPRPTDYLANFIKEGNVQKGSITYDLFYNEPLNFFRGIAGRFFNHFSGRFLFFEGDWANPRHTPPYQGVFVIGDMLVIVIGAVTLLKQKLQKQHMFVLLWLLFATLPSILSRDQVQAVRSFNLAIPLIIVSAYGTNKILLLRSRMTKIIIFGIYAATYIYFLDAYFVHQPIHNSQLWEYGYKQIVETVSKNQSKYKNVIIEQSYDQPYIYFLFFQKYDPVKWQAQAHLIQDSLLDVGHVDKLDNIVFRQIDWSRDRGNHGDLFVADIKTIPPLDSNDPREFNLVQEIKFLNGKDTAWRILEIKL